MVWFRCLVAAAWFVVLTLFFGIILVLTADSYIIKKYLRKFLWILLWIVLYELVSAKLYSVCGTEGDDELPTTLPIDNNAFLRIVIVSVPRGPEGDQSTLLQTLDRLTYEQSSDDLRLLNISITVAAEPMSSSDSPWTKHRTEAEQRYGHVARFTDLPRPHLPVVVSARSSLNDSLARMRWRSQQNLDSCYALQFDRSSSAEWVLFLEDDAYATHRSS